MRARVHDPSGPRALRVALFSLGFALLLAGLFGPAGPLSWTLLLIGAVLSYPFAALTERLAPRRGEVTLEAGEVVISGAGVLDQKLVSTKLAGAFAAPSSSGAHVVISRHDARRPPIVLEVDSVADARAVLSALGAGPRGFGKVTWELGAPWLDGITFATAVTTGASWVAFASLTWAGAGTLAGFFFLGAFAGSLLSLGLALARGFVARPSLSMRPDGVEVSRPAGGVMLPFASIVRIIPQRGAITFATSRPELAALVRCSQMRFSSHAPTSEERVVIVEQLEAALERARAHAPLHADAVAEIQRTRGESAKSWLARLEVAAGSLLGAGAYRHGAIDEGILWDVLEDHDREAGARAAAARLLVRVAPEAARLRIADVLAAVRSDADRALVRVAMEPDLETAAREIEALDQERQR